MKRRSQFLQIASSLLLALVLGVGGCCAINTVKPLEEAKTLANQSDYTSLAAFEIKCKDSCDGCNQLHLLKGDACYRLAKAGSTSKKYYACAAAELAEGIRLTQSWQMEDFDLNRPQTYTNLCEALRERRDMLAAADADEVNSKLLQQAQDFLAAEPDNPCGIYYAGNAQYAKMRTCLLHQQNCPALCQDLKNLQHFVARGMAVDGGQCTVPLQVLTGDIQDARQIANCP